MVTTRQRIYAAAPGLLISSRGCLNLLQQLGEAGEEVVPSLLREHRLVLLDTGSPQLYYRIYDSRLVQPATPPATVVTFGLEVLGGGIVFRDGYNLGPCRSEAPAATIAASDGYNLVEIAWESAVEYGEMIFWVSATPSDTRSRNQPSTIAIEYELPSAS